MTRNVSLHRKCKFSIEHHIDKMLAQTFDNNVDVIDSIVKRNLVDKLSEGIFNDFEGDIKRSDHYAPGEVSITYRMDLYVFNRQDLVDLAKRIEQAVREEIKNAESKEGSSDVPDKNDV